MDELEAQGGASASRDERACDDAAEPANVSAKAKPKRQKKGLIALSVLAAVVVAAGAGFWVWHEQPSFCGAICHDTMSNYSESWADSDYLVHDHAENDVACLDCHEPTISQQVNEAMAQIAGDYRLPLAKMKVEDEFCLRDGCHTREDIVAAGEIITFSDGTSVNPHSITFSGDYSSTESPHSVPGETISCSTCHTAHRSSTLLDYCYGCHHAETTQSCYECHDHR